MTPIRMQARMRRRLMRGVYPIPSLLTIGSLLCGFYAIVSVYYDEFAQASVGILMAALLDFLDGAVARLTGSTSELGVQLDSLADLVAFGVAPAMLVHVWAIKPWSRLGWFIEGMLPSALFVAAGAFRLARFNVQAAYLDKRYFVGLPIPGAAITVASFVLFMGDKPTFTTFGREIASREMTTAVVAVMTVVLAFLMVSRVRYRSLKGIELNRAWPSSALTGMTLMVMLLVVAAAARPRWVFFALFIGYALSGPVRYLYLAARRLGGHGDAPMREGVPRAEPPRG
jgi:CDP-diacylglycerol--serine O-phosphatidyltransferase